jgi:hypothetical protein
MKRVYPDDQDPLRTGPRPTWLRWLILAFLAGVGTILLLLFPAALRFVEMAALEARYFWWLILMVGLGIWLIWGYGRSAK